MNDKDIDAEFKLIAKRIKAARKKKGMTQLELSFQAGISQNMIACIESGKRNPTFQTVIKLCRALDLRLSDILKDIEPAAKTTTHEEKNEIISQIKLHLSMVIDLIDEL